MLGGGAPPASWTKEIAAHIKSLAPNSLVFDGTDGLTTYSGDLGNTGVKVDAVDLVYVISTSTPLAKNLGLRKDMTTQDRPLLPGLAVAPREGPGLDEQLRQEDLLRRRAGLDRSRKYTRYLARSPSSELSGLTVSGSLSRRAAATSRRSIRRSRTGPDPDP